MRLKVGERVSGWLDAAIGDEKPQSGDDRLTLVEGTGPQ